MPVEALRTTTCTRLNIKTKAEEIRPISYLILPKNSGALNEYQVNFFI